MIELGIFLTLLFLGYGFGRWAERKHYRSIQEREETLRGIPAITARTPPLDTEQQQHLVIGSVVVSVDYFKRFLATLRNFFGGRVTSYESLLDRARREALIRMKDQAKNHGAKYVFNVKLETSSISKGNGKTIGSVEVLAYGTAITHPQPQS